MDINVRYYWRIGDDMNEIIYVDDDDSNDDDDGNDDCLLKK